nr:MAG: ORF1 [TTV-like mini virus]UGV38627.1 MAG: ORF1 [TTV-like mini virus]
MPYYWRRQRRFRRRRFWPRRTRRTFQRRRRWYTRRNWVRRRRKIRHKLISIKLKEFQPDTIRNCKIIGNSVLFQGSPYRSIFNYTQYMYSMVPEYEPGGGGYCVMIHSLSSLWEDFQHLKNVWTASNAGLPLVRYLGAQYKFYQSATTDYCVQIIRCYPMSDFKYTHADINPSRMLLKKNVIRVPSRKTVQRKRPYKTVRVRPPAQLTNKWYFQKDICDTPLVMILATAVSFTEPYGASNWESNNLTWTCLNPKLFHFQNFQNPSVTTGYQPKPNTFLYVNGQSDTQPTQFSQLIYLGNSKEYTTGKQGDATNNANWGNIFHDQYLSGSEHTIYSSIYAPGTLKTDWDSKKSSLTKLAEPPLIKVRYNPMKDTGDSNSLYLCSNYAGQYWDPPENPNIIYSGFPLYDLIFGYLDWQEKVHEVQKILENQVCVFKSDFFNEKFTAYIPLDKYFIHGYSPYRFDDDRQPKITAFDHSHWYPCVRFQTESLNALGQTSPGAVKTLYHNYIQAFFRYKYYVKWGGCPKTLEKPYDPCSQPKWNLPSNLYEGIQIQNPGTAPETELQSFDWRRDYVKQKSIERIKKYTPTDEILQIVTDSKCNAPVLRQASETSSSSEEEEKDQTPLQDQIHRLRKQQQHLKRRILNRLKIQNLK